MQINYINYNVITLIIVLIIGGMFLGAYLLQLAAKKSGIEDQSYKTSLKVSAIVAIFRILFIPIIFITLFFGRNFAIINNYMMVFWILIILLLVFSFGPMFNCWIIMKIYNIDRHKAIEVYAAKQLSGYAIGAIIGVIIFLILLVFAQIY